MGTYYIPNENGWQANGGGVYSSYLRIRVDTSYNIASNVSTVTASLEAYNTTASWEWSVLSGGTITGNGQTLYTFDTSTVARTHSYVSSSSASWKQITSQSNPNAWTFNVQHASDGSASFSVGVNIHLYHYTSSREYYSYFSNLSGSIALSEPRASSVSSSNGTFGSAVGITINRYSSSFTHTVITSCLGRSETLMVQGGSVSLTWTPAIATYAPLMASSMSTTAVITCTTYSGSVNIGSSSVTITLTLPSAEVKPSAAITVSDAMGYEQTYGAYVATKSKYRIEVSPTLKYGASVSSYRISANGQSLSTSPAVTSVISSASSNSVSAFIIDSRGQQSNTASMTMSVLQYSVPTINSVSAERCNIDGTLNNSGAYMKVGYNISITPLNNINSKRLDIKYKRKTATGYQTRQVTLNTYNASGNVIIAADTDYSYDVQLVLSDDFGTSTASAILPTAFTMLNFRAGGDGIGIGKVAERQKAVDLAGDWELLKDGEPYVYAVGDIFISTNSTSPAARFGGTWEQIKDTFLLASGDTYTAGATGGEAEHTLSVDEIAAHDHPVTSQGYNVTLVGNVPINGHASAWFYSSGGNSRTGSTGGGQAHNNMPPYLAVYVWKRIA